MKAIKNLFRRGLRIFMPKDRKQKTQAKVVVLVGLPASGKSHYAKILAREGYKIINQDEIGTRGACMARAKAFLKDGQSVVIDRCNVDRKQRHYWVQLAKECKAKLECVLFEPHLDICAQNAEARVNHPNFPTDPDKIYAIIKKFNDTYEPPTKAEGFKSIQHHHPFHGFPSTYFYTE
jgi:atypical dual specificity phosphatase